MDYKKEWEQLKQYLLADIESYQTSFLVRDRKPDDIVKSYHRLHTTAEILRRMEKTESDE